MCIQLAHAHTGELGVTHRTAFAANNYVGDFSVVVCLSFSTFSSPLGFSPAPLVTVLSRLSLSLARRRASFPSLQRTGPAGFEKETRQRGDLSWVLVQNRNRPA